jgi:excisionase family DNA binding protein
MPLDLPYGKGTRMLTLCELCAWLNITERHARKLVERRAIPYRKVGHLLRFPEAEVEDWCRPAPRPAQVTGARVPEPTEPLSRGARSRSILPKSLID